MVEAAFMQSVPDAVRGRVFGFYVMVTGVIGALAPWVVGIEVKRLGAAAANGPGYVVIYGVIGGLGLLALAGLPCLHAIRKREHLDETGSEFAASPLTAARQNPAK